MWILIALLALAGLAGFVLFVSSKPDTFRWQRQTTIAAPAEKVFPLVDSFAAWRDWSPWEGLDPALQRSYSGPESGVGSAYAWQGNKKIGKGSMEITESQPSRRVALELDFIEPFEAHNLAEFDFSPETNGTRVTWTMSGQHRFMHKLMGVLIDMEALVGKDFEKGLAQLKVLAEK